MGWDLGAWETAAHAVGASHHTIYQRLRYLRRFATHHPNPTTVTPDDISTWIGNHPQWAPETRKAARGALSSWFRWAVRTGRATTNPVDNTQPVRIPTTQPHPVPEDVLIARLHATTDPITRLILLLGAYAGLRRAEIANVRYEDAQGGVLRVKGKGGRVRHVPMHPKLVAEWPTEGTGLVLGLTPEQVALRVKAALGGRWTTHSLRHRFATRLYAASPDVLIAQQLLGHSSPVTTQRYVQMPTSAAHHAVNLID